jgi:methionyl-tRNA synthetase
LKNPKRYTVTAALPYANGPLHIGHIAGCYLPSDIYVRFLRMKGKDVLFVCGSDEHGVPITIKARNEGITPQQVVDKYHRLMGDAFKNFGIEFDVYSRTSSAIHKQTASEFFIELHQKGELIVQQTEQFYDEEAAQFLADRYIVGTCPNCGFENAYGDQCENCGKSLSPEELINPRSKLSGQKPVKKLTNHWYLPLDKYQNLWLNEWIETHKDDWRPTVYGQCKSWLDQGLQPRAVTRDLDWGVPVPLPNTDGKVLYVWFDAPIGYISATKEWAIQHNTTWEEWWKDGETKLVHFIGKDNIVFHCIIFPAMLKAHGGYILPDQVPANEFLNLEGDKLSTSRNWAVWLHEYLIDFPNRQDELRYVLTSIAPETKDSDFNWKDYQARVNNELADILGNFVNRVFVLTHKYFGGKVPRSQFELDADVEDALQQAYVQIPELIETFQFRQALTHAMQIARAGNKYLADAQPWKLNQESESERIASIMAYSIEIVRRLSVVFEPFLPHTSAKLRSMLNVTDKPEWESLMTGHLPEGHQLNVPEILFKKIEDAQVEAQVQRLVQSKKDNLAAEKVFPEPAKETITFDDFNKIDLRVATVLEAEKVPKADKLLKLLVDTGVDKRTVVSGIAEHFAPEELIGKQVTILLNLAPRKIRGIESQGMLLFAENKEGKLILVGPENQTATGSAIR